jgi:2-hydroxycyclohexanecarboxyl-CoA dehydrogenase
MNLNLTGQRVAVLGAARGIGREIASAFLAEGAAVWTLDRDSSTTPLPGLAGSAVGDVTRYTDLQQFAHSIGPTDHMIYCVGVGSGKFGFPFWNLHPTDWAPVLEVNLIGAVNAAHAFAPQIIPQRSGSMLFLVSVAGQMGSQTDPPYSAAKAGLINFTQCAAKDLAPHGIRVNALSPGMVKTDLNQAVWQAGQAQLPPDQRQSYEAWAEEKIRKVSPLARWQTLPEFGAMATYLASDHARNITGQTLNIDGGQVMHA